MRIYDNEVAIQLAHTQLKNRLKIPWLQRPKTKLIGQYTIFSQSYFMPSSTMATCKGDIAAGLTILKFKSKLLQRFLQFFGTYKLRVATRSCNSIRSFTRLLTIDYSNRVTRNKHMCNSTKIVIEIKIDNG